MFLLDFLGIKDGFINLGIWMVSGIYKIASWAFEIFFHLSVGELVPSEKYQFMIENVYVLLGVILLFVLAFTLLKAMVNPDDTTKTASTVKKIILNLITSACLMAVLPTIFTFAYDFQTSIFTGNVIGRFFGYGDLDASDDDFSNITITDQAKIQANTLVNGVFVAFFNVNMDNPNVRDICDNIEDCQKKIESREEVTISNKIPKSKQTFETISNTVVNTGIYSYYESFSKNVEKKEIEFNFLLSLVAAGILVYVAVSYCFDMALRLIKLVFYQIIAPFPIFFRVMPEGKLSGIFNNWVKVTLTCYFEVYVRLIVIYVVLFLASEIVHADLFNHIGGGGGLISFVAKGFVLMGLVTFMKQAPKLISEVTGLNSGNMKLGIREKLAEGGAFTAGSILGGGITAGVRNATNKWGNKENWKTKDGKTTFGSVAKNLWAGLRSSGAGAISGAYHGGKAGWNAKSWGDMTSSAGKGAAKSVKNREARVDRKNRYKANSQGWAQGAIGGHILDVWEDVSDWATGGAAKYDAAIAAGEKFDSQYSKVKNVAGDVKKKKLSDNSDFFTEKIIQKVDDKYFKGSDASELKKLFEELSTGKRLDKDGNLVETGLKISNLRELEEYYTTLNSTILDKSDSKYRKVDEVAYATAVENAAKSVDIEKFRTVTRNEYGEASIRFDEGAYKKAIEDAKNSVSKDQFRTGEFDETRYNKDLNDLNTKKSQVASIIAQIDKKSTEEVIDLSEAEARRYGLGGTDFVEIESEKKVFNEMFNLDGGTVTDPVANNDGEYVTTTNVTTASGMKAAAEAKKNIGKKAAGEAKRIEIKKQARSNEDK